MEAQAYSCGVLILSGTCDVPCPLVSLGWLLSVDLPFVLLRPGWDLPPPHPARSCSIKLSAGPHHSSQVSSLHDRNSIAWTILKEDSWSHIEAFGFFFRCYFISWVVTFTGKLLDLWVLPFLPFGDHTSNGLHTSSCFSGLLLQAVFSFSQGLTQMEFNFRKDVKSGPTLIVFK